MSEEETSKLSVNEITEVSHENTEEQDRKVDTVGTDDQLKENKQIFQDEKDLSNPDAKEDKDLSSEIVDDNEVKDLNTEIVDDEVKESQKIKKSDVLGSEEDHKKEEIDVSNWLIKCEEFDPESLEEELQKLSENELKKLLKALKESNTHLIKENSIYEFILNEDELVQNTLEILEREDHPSIHDAASSMLSYPEKTYFARKKLQSIEKDFELKKAGDLHELQNLQFQLESLNIFLKNLKEEKEKFVKNIRLGGRHPVTGKVIQQKVAKYFDDSIGSKMAQLNRYKIQVQSDIMVRNKILCQIKTKALEREKCAMKEMQMSAYKVAHLQKIVASEKARNDQKIKELEATMQKIKLDPRRHNLPEVIDYASLKKENAALKESIKKWGKKVALAEVRIFSQSHYL
ncbi:uncharacterized protein LOC118195982 isoform X2 [Stegodyphus dumicola]|uniref:uncharacterized protein LOC118195982 isoform X2 n=1 Tax=Stegodyphus dumicola TaxID=202533 RepID=UPI0015B2DEFE|nr:uncharacterized protein LOC118195982 isoform X2 [Stegodyphus dumicola]